MGLNPYPSRSKRTHFAKTILDDFSKLEGQTATIAGRLMSWRKQGALAFAHVQDQSGKLQLFLRRNLVQPSDATEGRLGYAETNLLDIGDIIEATGKIIRTERGEISILVESLRLLTKAVRPLPDFQNGPGLKDREQVLHANGIWTRHWNRNPSIVLAPSAKLSLRFGHSSTEARLHGNSTTPILSASIRRWHGQAVQDACKRAGM